MMHFHINMKILSLILWLGGLCTDADNDADTDEADSNDTDNYAQ